MKSYNPTINFCCERVVSLSSQFLNQRLPILIYHRVHSKQDLLFPHEIEAASFDALMRFISSAFNVIPLGEAVTCLSSGTLPPRALAITFDDGYADNFEVALPILKRYGLAATFFVSTGFLDGGRMWNDSIIECVRASKKESVELERFGLGKVSMSSIEARRDVIKKLLSHIKYQTLIEREESIDSLLRIFDVSHLPTGLMMRSSEVKAMHAAGMEIGAHTINHPILTALALDEAEAEMAKGRERLQSIIDAPVDVFAYPNGKPGQDYDAKHASIAKRIGFRCAVTTTPGIATRESDFYQLPRYTPWGVSLPVWVARLLLNSGNTSYPLA